MEIKLPTNSYVFKNLIPCPKRYFIEDIDHQIASGNLCPNVPKYQTYNALYSIMKQKPHWQSLYSAITDKILKINPAANTLHSCWANVSREDTVFGDHAHETDITAVYYLHNKIDVFGTKLNQSIIIPGIENSVLIFNAKTVHSVVNIPKEMYNITGPRYSIVFDFICK